MSCFYSKGLKFSCLKCGRCCTGSPGIVLISSKDLENFTKHFQLSKREFIDKYCRAVDYNGDYVLALKERANYDCIFWNCLKGCTVYSSRPIQCRTYPFWSYILDNKESWKEEASFCPGIGKGKRYSKDELDLLLKERRENPPIKMEELNL